MKPVGLHPNPILAANNLNATFVERFWSNVNKTATCWVWIGFRDPDGYGRIAKGGGGLGPILAHRASWLIHFGAIPEDMNVLHDCPEGDTPACVNPAHLWLGTLQENNQDMCEKGRHAAKQPKLVGSRNPAAKLTEEMVLEILQRRATERISLRALADEYSVTCRVIWQIVHRLKWTHVISQTTQVDLSP